MPSKRRPFSVTLLLWMVLLLSAWGAVRFAAALRWQIVLREFDSSLSVGYLLVSGAGWGAVGSVFLVGILCRKRWAAGGTFAVVLLWFAAYWSERLFFESGRANLPFALTVSGLAAALAWILTTLPSTKSYFTQSEAHEQPVETPDTA